MTIEPGRIVRVTGFNNGSSDDLYAIDQDGALWCHEQQRYGRYETLWTVLPELPSRAGVADLYTHISWDRGDRGGVSTIDGALRVLDVTGKLWQLRWVNGEYLWDSVPL
jgi:hypothetical protein